MSNKTDEFDSEIVHKVYISVGIGKRPRDGFEILGVYESGLKAQSVADESGWRNAYVDTRDVKPAKNAD